MVAFIASLVITGLMVGVVIAVAKRRPPGTPLTWGEAFVAAIFVFTLMFVAYGVVPHHWLAWSSAELKWRSDVYGIPWFPGQPLAFQEGISIFGRGRILVPLSAISDIIATLIYVVAIVANVKMWSWWQNRGKKAPDARELTSAFGRPLLRKGG